MIYHPDKLTEPEKAEILELLQLSDQEFIPPLSSRSSTCQTDMIHGVHAGIYEYYQSLLQQKFLLCRTGEELSGLFSFRYGFIPEILTQQTGTIPEQIYITTIIVKKSYRRHGIAKEFYHELIKLYPNAFISTRTWNLNHKHINLLKELHFHGPIVIPNDRGQGIDTVYFYRGV